MTKKRVVTFTEEDIKSISEMAIAIARMQEAMSTIQKMTEESHRTLRGHNGTPGLMTRIATIELVSLENQKTLNGSDGQPGLVAKIEHIEDKLNDTAEKLDKVNSLTLRVNDLYENMKEMMRYPSLTWMVHYKFKGMAIITATAVVLITLIAFPGTAVAQQLQFIIERLFVKWLGM